MCVLHDAMDSCSIGTVWVHYDSARVPVVVCSASARARAHAAATCVVRRQAVQQRRHDSEPQAVVVVGSGACGAQAGAQTSVERDVLAVLPFEPREARPGGHRVVDAVVPEWRSLP